MKLLPKLTLGLVVVLLGMQLVRPEKTNPPVTGEVTAPAEVLPLLRRACYDCHSNETKWPWYADVAPVSWLVVHHTDDGRKHLNFSTWASYEPKKQAHKLEECEELVQSGDMPMPGYVALHPEAKLSDAEKATLLAWFKTRGAPPAPKEEPKPEPTPEAAPAAPADAGAP